MHDFDRHELRELRRDDVAVTVLGIRLEAQQAHAPASAHDLREIGEGGLRVGRRHVREKDRAHLRVLSRARGGASIGGRAERAEVQISDTDLFDTRGELRLREARPSRARDRANVDEQLYTGLLERTQKAIGRGTLISDRARASARAADAVLRRGSRVRRRGERHGSIDVEVAQDAVDEERRAYRY